MSEQTTNIVQGQFIELSPEERVRFMAHLTLGFGIQPQMSFQMLGTVMLLRNARRMPDHDESQMIQMMVDQANNELSVPAENLRAVIERTLAHAESVVVAYESAVIDARQSDTPVDWTQVDDLMSERGEVIGSDFVTQSANDEQAEFKA